jgi:uncharacterized membrane protein YphA (DoxX/SURF4 family)
VSRRIGWARLGDLIRVLIATEEYLARRSPVKRILRGFAPLLYSGYGRNNSHRQWRFHMRTKHWIFGPGTAGSPTADAGLAEFMGGLLIAIGLLTRPAAAFVFVHFVIVVFVAHAGDSALALASTGPGRYSVDALIAGRTARRAGTLGR